MAARTQRLYDVVVGEDERVIAAGMLQDTLKEADGRRREEELGALMVHPAARGIGIVGLMVKLVLVHRYAVLCNADTEEDYIAHVVDGNLGPIHALLAAGFEDLGPMKLHPGEFDGHVEHMMAPGEDYVPMHAYRFDSKAIDNLIRDLWSFWHGARELSRPDWNLRMKVDFPTWSIRLSWTRRLNASDDPFEGKVWRRDQHVRNALQVPVVEGMQQYRSKDGTFRVPMALWVPGESDPQAPLHLSGRGLA